MHSTIGFIALLIAFTISDAPAQQQYNDVALIVNSNSTVSGQIGTYFAAHRAIPSTNIITIAVPTAEEITDAEFANLRKQVEDIITARGLTTKLNYLVTTKGMPLKVKRADMWASASVESELSLILGAYASSIGGTSRIASPYYGSKTDFTRGAFGIYLVTRLDGYTVSDVYGLIDRSSMVPAVIPAAAKFVLDADPVWNTNAPLLNTNLATASTILKARAMTVTLDQSSTYLTSQTGVMGYASWGSNDNNWAAVTTNATQKNTYLPGAIGETYVSTSGRSFTTGLTYGQSAAADMIAEGITAVKAYVYEPFQTAMADAGKLFPMYAEGYTVAEAFYSSSKYLSWMDVVIGDPKGRMVNSAHNSSALPVELVSFTVAAGTAGSVLKWNTATENGNYGFEIERKGGTQSLYVKIGFVAGAGTTSAPHSYTFTDPTGTNGTYTYRLKQIDTDGQFVYSGEITLATVTGIETVSGVPTEFAMGQNYPNPFNPTTQINFSLANLERVHLAVYDALGRVVETLVNDQLPAGNYSARWNAANMPSGAYFYRITAGTFTSVKKLMLQK